MIDPHCDRCGRELDEPGAILLGPPDAEQKVLKHHLCQECYEVIADRDLGRVSLTEARKLPGVMEAVQVHAAVRQWRCGW